MTIQDLVTAILEKARHLDRVIVAIAGAPGAGKSTLADALVQQLHGKSAKLVPMDGFHYDNAVLTELGLRHCKGAPETFDFGGFWSALKRLRSRESRVAVPIFDRHQDLARAGASLIHDETEVLVVEGNYLLLDEEPWRQLRELFDLTIFLEVPRNELERRLLQRWIDLGDSAEKAQHWVETNDMPNVDRVLSRRLVADIVFQNH